MPGEQLGSEYKGPGPVLYSRGKRTEQNKTKSDWVKVTSHVITFLLWLYIGVYLYTEQEAICLEDCCIGEKCIFLICLPIF